MKKIFLLSSIVLIAFACHRKTVADSDIVLSNKTGETKKAGEPKVELNATATEQARQGSVVYSSRCGNCHALKPVARYTPAEWDNILKSMIPKAKLNDAEAKQVTAYVMEHSKK